MVGVVVTFRFGTDFDPEALTQKAETTRSRFQGLRGLDSKYYWIDKSAREGGAISIWESKEVAEAFFDAALLEGLARLYGARPEIRIVEIPLMVDNRRTAALPASPVGA